MASKSLKIRILFSFLAVVLALSVLIALLGYFVIKKDIIERAQDEVAKNLSAARFFLNAEIENIGKNFAIADYEGDVGKYKDKLGLDYFVLADQNGIKGTVSEIATRAIAQRRAVGGARIISYEELTELNGQIRPDTKIEIKDTPMAGPSQRAILYDVMAKEYAIPLFDNMGQINGVMYGGKIINNDHGLVDKIRFMVFGVGPQENEPVGTVTIFQDDVRISTNVLDETGGRAIGTRVSEEVYKHVVNDGKIWHGRAFVVTDWYETAYEPIRDISGNVIGILYVGIPEKPFDDMARRITLLFLFIISGCAVLAVLLTLFVTFRITEPITRVLDGTFKISEGGLGYEVHTETGIKELDNLAIAFNTMSTKLKERDGSLRQMNQRLVVANQNYVDLISFVAHELKGILASAVMNAYAIRDGFLGMINFKQRKAIDSVTRNLDYLDSTVKKFLNLGRIERDELELNKSEVLLRKDVFKVSLESLSVLAVNKKITINNNLDDKLTVNADIDLLLIVANNLLSNAIKYGTEGGKIEIKADRINGFVVIEVYNDSVPISEQQQRMLFQKFTRLENEQTKKVKGTGLGLYIAKQIVEKHGGDISVEPREKGNAFIFKIEG